MRGLLKKPFANKQVDASTTVDGFQSELCLSHDDGTREKTKALHIELHGPSMPSTQETRNLLCCAGHGPPGCGGQHEHEHEALRKSRTCDTQQSTAKAVLFARIRQRRKARKISTIDTGVNRVREKWKRAVQRLQIEELEMAVSASCVTVS